MMPEHLDAFLRDHLALALLPGLGPKLTRAVLDHFGSPRAVLQADAGQLALVPMVGAKLAARFAEAIRTLNVDAEWQRICHHGVQVHVWGEPGYPERLTTIDNAPPLVYMRGEMVPADTQAVGIVGSRQCTAYGRRVTEKLAAGLAQAGYTVVSGLARGIDGVAHRAALDAGGRTIAVLAGGLSSIYPPEHTELAGEIAKRGALITETPMTVDPQAGMFPARNRIISALSRAVVIVEANVRSGALITATHAAEQGREVYAVPGNVDSVMSAGCLDLIRKGARLVRSADDIIEDLRGLSTPEPPQPIPRTASLFDSAEPAAPTSTEPPPGMDELQSRVWTSLDRPMFADQLAAELNIATSELAAVLMRMEMKRWIRRLPGNAYERR